MQRLTSIEHRLVAHNNFRVFSSVEVVYVAWILGADATGIQRKALLSFDGMG